MTIQKIILTVVILFGAGGALMLVWTPKKKEIKNPLKYIIPSEPCFEVKIVSGSKDYYYMFFTNDGWASQEELLILRDYTDQSNYIEVLVWNAMKGKEAASEFASTFSSYKECVENNFKVLAEEKRLNKLYKEQGIISFEEYYKNNIEEKPVKKEPKEIIINRCK